MGAAAFQGIRSVRGPVLSTAAFLESLSSDIICFQEFKVPRNRLDSDLCVVPGFDAFLAVNGNGSKVGYSGVGTYCRQGPTTPHAAEDGFATGTEARTLFMGLGYGEKELASLDGEGRCVITDHKLFMLFNIYFPNGTDDRMEFKLRFHQAIEHRVRDLRRRGREVVLVGDFNVCHRPIDHCDPTKCNAEFDKFEDTASRRWMETFLNGPDFEHVDVFRHFHPDKRGAFTCWNTLIDARKSNYGTRIDYIICTPALLPWFASCHLEQDMMGSDHCPVVATLHDVHPITGVHLVDALNGTEASPATVWPLRDPPPLCARFWEAFAGRQADLKSWFKRPASAREDSGVEDMVGTPKSASDLGAPQAKRVAVGIAPPIRSLSQPSPLKAKLSKQQQQQQQRTLNSFFTPKGAASKLDAQRVEPLQALVNSKPSPEPPSCAVLAPKASTEATAAWRSLLEKPPVPKCLHEEPSKEFTVNKSGPNKGRVFYLCARPVGPSDGGTVDGAEGEKKGVTMKKGQRLTEFRCDFFQWKKSAGGGGPGRRKGM
ncbi:DNA-(apurinic or apyrimidinic site) lyase 2 [Irineochytrium annulatum]|nr:DNA-(apurinic or apyrimidinic site) lyase 2 [Irineochytrium annulatum]